MRYEFKCVNISCTKRNVIIEKDMPMNKSGESQYCEKCKESLQKIYGVSGIKTGDGYKS